MSDYCKQCSEYWFGEDFRELAGLITEEEVKQGLGACVLCESCGAIRVDHEGRRLDPNPEAPS